MLIKTCIYIAAHNSFVVQMTVTTYFHVGIWCVLEFGRSPGLSSWLLTPSRPKTVVFVIHSDLQLRDSDGITPFFPIKPSRSLAPTLTRYVIFTYYNILKSFRVHNFLKSGIKLGFFDCFGLDSTCFQVANPLWLRGFRRVGEDFRQLVV